MGTIPDDIGVWNQLGTIQPSFDEWIKYPTISNGANNTFRIEVVCSDPQKITSYILLRSRFTTAKTNQVEESKRIYPKSHIDEKLLFQLPLNKELFDRSIYLRYIEIKRVYIRQKGIGINQDTSYSIKLEELW